MICNPYFEYYLTYFIASNKWHSRMYKSIGGYINDADRYLCDTLESFQISFKDFKSSANTVYEAVTLDDMAEFVDFAEKNISGIVRNAMAYGKGEIELKEIKQVYELIGLFLERRIIKVTKDDKTVAYAVCEVFSNGLNLFNLLDSIHIFLLDEQIDLNPLFEVVMIEAKFLFDQFNKNNAYIFVKLEPGRKDNVDVQGINYYDLLGRGIVNKSGIVEYKNLLLNMSR